MANKYDIFISYRREGGYDTAKHLNDLLVRDGYKVSFDIDTLRSGDFDTQLLNRIDQCKDFILIVDRHAFDRTLDPNFNPQNDWLRCELAYALKKNKNIVPVFLSGVTGFPANLPKDVAEVTKKNGPEYNRYHFNAFYEDLKKRFIISRSHRRFFLYFVIVSVVVLIITLLLLQLHPQDTIEQNEDIALTTEVLPESQEQERSIPNEENLIDSPSLENNKYETNLTLIEIGDFFYEDHSFSHDFYNDKKCIGVVYDREAPYYANIIALDNYGSGNWSVYEKVQKNGVTYSAGGLKWRIPYVIEWITILQTLANVECHERTEAPNIGVFEFDSKKALKGLARYHLHFEQEGWYWADGGYMSESGEDECWSLSFVNECLYPGTESSPYFRYVADIEE